MGTIYAVSGNFENFPEIKREFLVLSWIKTMRELREFSTTVGENHQDFPDTKRRLVEPSRLFAFEIQRKLARIIRILPELVHRKCLGTVQKFHLM